MRGLLKHGARLALGQRAVVVDDLDCHTIMAQAACTLEGEVVSALQACETPVGMVV